MVNGFDPACFMVAEKGWFSGFFYGDANGLIGPFNAVSPVSWSSPMYDVSYTGQVSLWGSVVPNVPTKMAKWMSMFCCPPDRGCPCGHECEMISGKDVMFFTGYITADTKFDELPDWENFCVKDGMIQIINGQLSGSYGKCGFPDGYWVKNLLGGEYCSNMAAQASRAIEARFIEPDSVTVKQLPMLTDLDLVKSVEDVNGDDWVMGDEAHFTVTLTNLGPSNATSVMVMDVLPDELSLNLYSVSQGFYDVTSGYWIVGDLVSEADATLEIWANVNTVGKVWNRATVAALDEHDPVMDNNMAEVMMDVGSAGAVEQVTLDLDAGLNLISLPLIPDYYDDPVNALSGVTFGTVYQYRHPAGPAPSGWVWYINGGSPQTGFQWRDGIGYWIDVSPADELIVDGDELVSGPVLPPSYDVYDEWNLIGFKSATAKLPSEYLAGIAGKYTMIYGFDNGAFYAIGSPGHAMLEPGHGYWIALKVGESGKIFP